MRDKDKMIKELEGKFIFVSITTPFGKRQYSGIVKEVTYLGDNIFLIGMIDKYGKFVAFSSKDIEILEEENKIKGVKEGGEGL